MQLKRFTYLGLRILYYLADKTDRTVTLAEIAEALDCSRNLIMKMARFMAGQGWITVVRGRTGGLVLAQAAGDYKLGSVCRVLEGEEGLLDGHEPPCPSHLACSLTPAFEQAKQAFYRDLDWLTLEDSRRRGAAALSAAGGL